MKPTPEQVVAEVIAALPEKFEWFYLNYDDELHNQQVAQIINGGITGYDDVREGLDENLTEYRWQQESDAIGEAFKDSGHDEHRELLTSDDEDEIRQALWDRDQSDPLEELLKGTPDKFFRYRVEDIEVGAEYLMNESEYEQQLREIAEAVGIDFDTNRAALSDMLANSGDGGALFVFWRGDVAQMVRAAAPFGDPVARTITWENPSLLVLNIMQGSGFECDVVGTITLPFDADNLYLDAQGIGPGYSWNETTGGLVGNSYDNSPTITEKENADAAHVD